MRTEIERKLREAFAEGLKELEGDPTASKVKEMIARKVEEVSKQIRFDDTITVDLDPDDPNRVIITAQELMVDQLLEFKFLKP